MQLDDLRARRDAGGLARRTASSAPRRARSSARRTPATAASATALGVPAARADDAGHARCDRGLDVRERRPGSGEVDHRLGVVERVDEPWPAPRAPGASTVPTLPAAAVQEDLHAAGRASA